MKDEDGLIPTTTAKKETSDSSFFGKGRYKFWALAAILLLAFWSMFTGTVTLRWSAGNLNRFTEDLDNYIHDDLDVLVSLLSDSLSFFSFLFCVWNWILGSILVDEIWRVWFWVCFCYRKWRRERRW